MKAGRQLSCGVFLCLLASQGPLSPAHASPSVTASIDPLEATVGDRVEVHLTVHGIGSPDPPLLPRLESWGEAEVLEVAPFRASDLEAHPASFKARMVVTAFRTGPVELPPVPLTLPGGTGATVMTPEGLGFEVLSVLPVGEQAFPMPPAPPRALPGGELLGWLLLLTAACAMALLAALYWRRRRQGPTAAAPALAPLPALLAELQRLEGSPSPETLYTGLSLALRRYLREVLAIPTLERTTTEIQRSLARTPLAATLTRRAVELLRLCDGVKFARQELSAEATASHLDGARLLGQDVHAALKALGSPSEEAA